MKRVKAACIFQTLVFSQKPELGYSKEEALKVTKDEVSRYISSLEKSHTRYIITDTSEQEDGSVILHVRKEYNKTSEVSEYFN